jgi:hypothetical protein
MTVDTRLVFDEVIEDMTGASGTSGGVSTYTSLEHSDFLAGAQQLAFHALWEGNTGDPSLTVQIETSGDGRTWLNKVGTLLPEFIEPDAVGVGSATGGEPWPARPNPRFVRLRITASGKTSPFSLRVKLYACARTRRQPPRLPRVPAGEPSTPQMAVSRETAAEVASLLAVERGAGPGAAGRAAQRLSAAARDELSAFHQSLVGMSASHRAQMARSAQALAGVLDGITGSGPCKGCDGDCGGCDDPTE